MLPPEFFISPAPVPEGVTFALLGYAQVGTFRLVRWRWGLTSLNDIILDDLTEGPYTDGETLWRGDRLLGHYWGGAELYAAPPLNPSQIPAIAPTVWDLIDARVGQDGIPPDIAIALRNPRNYVTFRGDRAPLLQN